MTADFVPYSERVAVARVRHDEDKLQRQVFDYLRLGLPHDAMAWHTPNGGLRSKREAARLSTLGVRAGIPDIAICWRGRLVMVELKTPRGVVSADQRATMRDLLLCGADVFVSRSLGEVESQLREMGMPLRATVA